MKAPFSGTIDLADYASTYKEVDASSNGNEVNIMGNAQANVIRAGSSGSSMDGGLGADKLYGGSGADTYSYSVGGGADQFFNYSYEQGDVVKINGTVKSSSISGKNVVLKVGSGSLTVDNAVDKMISININGTTADYRFDKNNATLAKAAANANRSNAQLPAEAYWFIDEPSTDPTVDPLDQILEPENISVDTSALFDNTFDRFENELITAARHCQKNSR